MATLGEQAVGSIVKLNVNGVAKEFIVVHQGLPSSAYDSSCDGTWLLMKDCYTQMAFDSTNNDYANSDVHSYLNNTFVNLLDGGVQKIIKQVKIPYKAGTGSSTTVSSGSSGLSTKAFLISATESGYGVGSSRPIIGSAFAYFNGAANSKRIAYLSGTKVYWWTRTPYNNAASNIAYGYGTSGNSIQHAVTSSYGVRPALILPPDFEVDSDGMVLPFKKAFGHVNILGSNKELTGAGLVKINGVLCQLTSSIMKHSGVIKSLFIGTPASRLPSGYTEVEYIETTGTQYIDTGFKPNQNTRVIIDFALTDASATNNLLGARTGTSSNAFTFSTVNGYWRVGYNTTSQLSTAADTQRHTADMNKNVLKLDGTTIHTASAATFTAPVNMFVGEIQAANTTRYPSYAKIYSCQIYDNGTLIRDFVPCKNSSGAAGLYDLVNSTFYGNSGTGSFTAGAEV